MQCVEELNIPGVLPVFVQVGVESTLERSQITRDHMGQLLYKLVQSEKLSKQDFFKGLVVCQGRKQDLWVFFLSFMGAHYKQLHLGWMQRVTSCLPDGMCLEQLCFLP